MAVVLTAAAANPPHRSGARALEPQACLLLAGQLQQLNAQALALTQGWKSASPWRLPRSCWPSRWTAPLALAHEYLLLQVEVLTACRAMRWRCCTQAAPAGAGC